MIEMKTPAGVADAMALASVNPADYPLAALSEANAQPSPGVYRVAVPGPPAPWSVYVRHMGKPSMSFLAMKDYQERIQGAILEQVGHPMLIGPVFLDLRFYCKVPASARVPRSPGQWADWLAKNPPTKADLRNLEKAAEDACQGLLFINDSLVVESHGWKGYDLAQPDGYTVIRVRPYRLESENAAS